MSESPADNGNVDGKVRVDTRNCRIGYGLLGADLKHVSEVPRGLVCGCLCVECGAALIAKKGPKRAAHFSHFGESTCDGGVETVIHRLAKEIFQQIREMELPAYEFSRSSYVNLERVRYSGVVREARRVAFNKVDTERPLSGLIPDIVIWNGKYPLIVEIAVTHRVDEEKRERIKALNTPAIEIRLSPADALLSREELLAKIESEPTCKHWLFHPHLAKHERKFQECLERERRHQIAVQRLARRAQEMLFQARRRSPWRGQRFNTAPGGSLMDIEAAIRRFYRQYERYPPEKELMKMLFTRR